MYFIIYDRLNLDFAGLWIGSKITGFSTTERTIRSLSRRIFGREKTRKLQKLKSTKKESDANYVPNTDREEKETSGFKEQGSNIKQTQQQQQRKKTAHISDVKIKDERCIQRYAPELISAEAL